MIRMKRFAEASQDTVEGKLLLAALAVLTSLDEKDIEDGTWGGMTHPDEAFERVVELANKIFHEEEWKAEEVLRKRDAKINGIIGS